MKEFFLSTEVPIELTPVPGAPTGRWMLIAHSGVMHPAFVLLAGETLELTAGLRPAPDSQLLLSFGAAHGQLSDDGATLAVSLVADGFAESLAAFSIPAGSTGLPPRDVVLDLGAHAGRACRLRLQAGAGPAANSLGDWVALYEVVVAPAEDLARVRKRAFHAERSHNELSHFAHVYEHQIYHPDAHADTGAAALPCRSLHALIGSHAAAPAATDVGGTGFPAPSALDDSQRDPYHYSHALLTGGLQSRPPSFGQRLRELRERTGRPLRILSLCCGAARIEAAFAAEAGIDARWTLMDLSDQLLRTAAGNFPAGIVPELIVGNLNEIRDYGGRYDVIMCVSGLHHIVELERVVRFIRDALVEDGEFWSIGEAIGRNGNRLWGRDYAVANAFFRSLPERLRRNRASGKVDANLPDVDYSSGTFEGIRSEEIEPLLSRFLEPVQLYRRNCFLWRLVDLAYADNYAMTDPGDIAWLQRAVRAELAHFRDGGRPTELHGIFRRRAL